MFDLVKVEEFSVDLVQALFDIDEVGVFEDVFVYRQANGAPVLLLSEGVHLLALFVVDGAMDVDGNSTLDHTAFQVELVLHLVLTQDLSSVLHDHYFKWGKVRRADPENSVYASQ